MQEVFENIIKALAEKRDEAEKNMELSDVLSEVNSYGGMFDAFDKSIEIVKQTAEEFGTDTNVGSNGWIPCSEKLPELRQDVLVTVKYTGFMGMYGYWIKTGHMEAENDWWGDCAGGEVIAWQPLPKPYQPKGE